MSEKKDTFSVWLKPYGDIAFKLQQRIKNLSKEYNSPVFEPHVTLIGGLERGETEMIQLSDTLAGCLEPFELVLTKAGYLDTFYQSLFVHIQENDQLLHARKIAERLFNYNEDSYMPHLSILYGDFTRNEKERILNVMGREFHIRFPVHSLLLVKTSGKPDQWKKIHSADFQRE